MDFIEFLVKYFVYILLTVVILITIFVGANVLGLNFKRYKNQKLTKKVSFAPNI